LKYAKWAGSVWSIQTVDSTGDVGQCSSLALGYASNPHISYYDATNKDLKYAKFTESYSVTFSQVGISDYEGDVLMVDSIVYHVSDLPLSFEWDVGTRHTFNFSSTITGWPVDVYVWSSTSGLSTRQNDTLTVSQSGTVQATYQLKTPRTTTPPTDTVGPTLSSEPTTPTPTTTEPPPTPINMIYVYASVIAVALAIAVVVAVLNLRRRALVKPAGSEVPFIEAWERAPWKRAFFAVSLASEIPWGLVGIG
jgi:hypothetical protein